MDKNKIETQKIVEYWITTSNEDFETMKKLFDSKSYSWVLFLGHISVEKLLKALYVSKHKKHPPFIHNLYRLAEICEVEISDETADWLDVITTFNLKARYEDYKREFYKKCTKEYTETWIKKIESIRLWIKKML